jgi:hypothetical protein
MTVALLKSPSSRHNLLFYFFFTSRSRKHPGAPAENLHYENVVNLLLTCLIPKFLLFMASFHALCETHNSYVAFPCKQRFQLFIPSNYYTASFGKLVETSKLGRP